MRKLSLLIVSFSSLALWGCSGNTSSDGGIGGNNDAGSDGGLSNGAFNITDLDLQDGGLGANDVVAAALSNDGRIGIAYYWDLDAAHKRLEYLEVETDGSTQAITLAASVQRSSGLSVVFDSSGNADVAYLGNDPSFNEPIETMAPDGGVFWTESDLALATISPTGSLSTDYVEHNGTERGTGLCENPVSERDSPVVGLSPAIAVEGDQLVIVFRNIHDGQFPIQDYGDSDLESVIGVPGNWTHQVAYCGADNGGTFVHVGAGAETSVTNFNGNVLALTAGEVDADTTIAGLYEFTLSSSTWGNRQQLFQSQSDSDGAGPKIVASADAGVGMAWVEMSASTVHFASSADGQTWSPAESVFGAGTGGWFPSLAFDPTLGLPSVAYFVCSPSEPNVNEGSCPADGLELQVASRKPDGSWFKTTVDSAGGIFPSLLFNNAQMVVVYRTLAGGIRIARQASP